MKQAATSYSLVMTQDPPHSAEGWRPTIPLRTAGRAFRRGSSLKDQDTGASKPGAIRKPQT